MIAKNDIINNKRREKQQVSNNRCLMIENAWI